MSRDIRLHIDLIETVTGSLSDALADLEREARTPDVPFETRVEQIAADYELSPPRLRQAFMARHGDLETYLQNHERARQMGLAHPDEIEIERQDEKAVKDRKRARVQPHRFDWHPEPGEDRSTLKRIDTILTPAEGRPVTVVLLEGGKPSPVLSVVSRRGEAQVIPGPSLTLLFPDGPIMIHKAFQRTLRWVATRGYWTVIEPSSNPPWSVSTVSKSKLTWFMSKLLLYVAKRAMNQRVNARITDDPRYAVREPGTYNISSPHSMKAWHDGEWRIVYDHDGESTRYSDLASRLDPDLPSSLDPTPGRFSWPAAGTSTNAENRLRKRGIPYRIETMAPPRQKDVRKSTAQGWRATSALPDGRTVDHEIRDVLAKNPNGVQTMVLLQYLKLRGWNVPARHLDSFVRWLERRGYSVDGGGTLLRSDRPRA